MYHDLEKQVGAFLESENLFAGFEKVLVAVSGGGDSVALLNVLVRLKRDGVVGAKLAAGHVNHNLRGSESDGDSKFVSELGAKFGLEVLTRSVETIEYAKRNKLSIETAARQLRFDALCEMCSEAGAKCIVTAHHKDDNAETMIHRLMRGTGFRGLGGIWPVKEFGVGSWESGVRVVRPLLCVGRKDIEKYCSDNDLRWRTDGTNAETIYTRNKIRHLLLPDIQKGCQGDLAEKLFELSLRSQKLYAKVEARAEQSLSEMIVEFSSRGVVLDRNRLSQLDRLTAVEVVRRVLVNIGSGERDLTQEHYDRIIALASANSSGKLIELPSGFVAKGEYDRVAFYKGQKANKRCLTPLILVVPGVTVACDIKIEAKVLDASDCDIEKFKKDKDSNVEWFDLDKIKGRLKVRSRKDGDKFRPIGGGGEKRIGKFLTADKVPGEMRDKVLVIEDDEKIIWLAPIRASEETKVDGSTKKVLAISLF
ncbi:MAG: tRNA lysidine(34) synthetase TilS [Planctomycetes bacterium]|nr:tRNA lysidine(34) synthetase TilS [Planctomycetota bacterium]